MTDSFTLTNVHLATMDASRAEPYGAIPDACIGIRNGKIDWISSMEKYAGSDNNKIVDGKGGWLTPGLIDCHTHLIYGGNRATEWESRLEGASYEEIARRGGGIVSTVTATREASFDSLLKSAGQRLRALMAEGVTTIEIKSGYGLELETERKMLNVAKKLETINPVHICRTFLGAHALPPEFAGKSGDYIHYLVTEMLPTLAEEGLMDAVDVFCEGIGFSPSECRQVFECARGLGLPVKGHVEQLSNLQGARLVAAFNGLSVDHLEFLETDDITALKKGDVVAVLLPGAYYFLGETQLPPVEALKAAEVPIAIGSDLNPGSSPICSLLFTMNMACVQFGLTPEDALTGTTRQAAKALGLEKSKGMLREGMDADMVLWPINHPAELSYGVNMTRPAGIWVGGLDARPD